MRELTGSLSILAGAFFLFSAGLGLLRMPDAYTRIQAGTKATTLGNVLVLTGVAIDHPQWAFRLALVIGFVLLSNPVSSHALSRTAWLTRTPTTSATVIDALADEPQRRDAAERGK